jgi:hypothetical protein
MFVPAQLGFMGFRRSVKNLAAQVTAQQNKTSSCSDSFITAFLKVSKGQRVYL